MFRGLSGLCPDFLCLYSFAAGVGCLLCLTLSCTLVLGSLENDTCFDQFCVYLWGSGRTLHSAFRTAEPCLWLFFSNASSIAFSWITLIHTYSCPSSSFRANLLSSALSVLETLKCSVLKGKHFGNNFENRLNTYSNCSLVPFSGQALLGQNYTSTRVFMRGRSSGISIKVIITIFYSEK